MHSQRRFAVTAAIFLAAVWTLGGCSESESREASKKLRERTDESRREAESASGAAAAGVAEAGAEAAEARQKRHAARLARDVLMDWVRAQRGREEVLIDPTELRNRLLDWQALRDRFADIEAMDVGIGDRAASAQVVNTLDRMAPLRRSDLPPLPPESADELDAEYWQRERAKRRVVTHIQSLVESPDPNDLPEFLEPLFVDFAVEALEAYVRDEPQRLDVLTASPQAALERIGGWVADPAVRNAIIQKVPQARTAPVADRIGDVLQDPQRREQIVARLRQTGSVGDELAMGAHGEALERLHESEQKLRDVVARTSAAAAADKDNARAALVDILARQAGFHAADARQAAQLVDTAAANVTRWAHHAENLLARAERQAAFAGGSAAKLETGLIEAKEHAAEAKRALRKLEGTVSETRTSLERTTEQAERLSAAASEAYTRVATATGVETIKKALDEYVRLQAKADEAASKRDRLDSALKRAEVDRDMARLAAEAANERVALHAGARQELTDWREGQRKQWRYCKAAVARVRRALADELAQVTAGQRRLSGCAVRAAETYQQAVDEAEALRDRDVGAPLLMMRRADVMAMETRTLDHALAATARALRACRTVPAPPEADSTAAEQAVAHAADTGAQMAALAGQAYERPAAAGKQYLLAADSFGTDVAARAAVARANVEAGRMIARRIALQRGVGELGAALVRLWSDAAGGTAGGADALADRLAAEDAAGEGEALAGQLRNITAQDGLAAPEGAVDALARMFATMRPTGALREQAEEQLDKAGSLCRSALETAGATTAQTDTVNALAAAYMVRMRLARAKEGRDAVLRQAKQSPLGTYLTSVPPEQAGRMPAIRQLRRVMGLVPMPEAAAQTTETDETNAGDTDDGGTEADAAGAGAGSPPM
ncbi:MAG: hypothetical protein KGY99_09300 [Phycisphaerae bacterium]|nr:hypothetical protein [Phycisphaerae bacterium]